VAKDFLSVLGGKPVAWVSKLLTLNLRRFKMEFMQNTLRVLGKSGLSVLKGPIKRVSRDLWHSAFNDSGLRMQWVVKGWKIELQVQGSAISINVKK